MPHELRDEYGNIVDGYIGVSIEDDSDWFGGWDRFALGVVENADEIREVFSVQRQPKITCGWCGSKYRSLSKDKAVRWFNAHDCKTLEMAEGAALVVSLTPLASERRAA